MGDATPTSLFKGKKMRRLLAKQEHPPRECQGHRLSLEQAMSLGFVSLR